VNISALQLNKLILSYSIKASTDGFHGFFVKNILNQNDRNNYITHFIEELRFFDNLSGYYYCYDTNFVCVAHPILKNYIGGNHLEDTDSKGTKFAYLMRDVLRSSGGGFVEHYWQNQTTGIHELKLAYVHLIKETDVFLGTGVSVDYQKGWMVDSIGLKKEIIRNMVHAMTKGISGVFKNLVTDSLQRVNFMRDFLDQIRFFGDKSGYFFVDDLNYFSVIFPTQKSMEGQSLYDYVDPKGNYPVRSMVDIIRKDGRGFVEYYFTNPTNNQTEKKMVYVERIENTDYFIGSGIYF